MYREKRGGEESEHMELETCSWRFEIGRCLYEVLVLAIH